MTITIVTVAIIGVISGFYFTASSRTPLTSVALWSLFLGWLGMMGWANHEITALLSIVA